MVYIYIDESGDLTPVTEGGKPLFILGCVITDNISVFSEKIRTLKSEILNSSFYRRHRDNFLKDGFHASTNHPDIYSQFVALLNTLNFKAYVVFADKKNTDFEKTFKSHPDFYNFFLQILLKDRLLKRKGDKIHVVLEQGGDSAKPHIAKKNIQLTLENINKTLIHNGYTAEPLDITFEIKGKNTDAGLDIVDYVNHILYSAASGDKKGEKHPYQRHNLALIEPKIAVVYNFLDKRYYRGRREITSLYDFLNHI